ncbi:phage tail spike protein [Halobacillus salinus]|uniref:phage tail spike protein n=1 Tax=Halobacillus salinus TaxID=192814 RepID=UPI0009A58505|nr:phage tail spike protein [Halobacillus salinus]
MTQPFRTSTPIWIYDKDERLRLVLDPKGSFKGHSAKDKKPNYTNTSAGVIGHHYLSEEGKKEAMKIPHYNSWFTEELNGEVKLEFTVPARHPDVSWIENEGRAVIRDRDGNLVEFIIREPYDRNGSSGPEKEVTAEGSDYELIDEWIGGYKADNVTLRTALTAILSSTRFEVGEVDDFGTQSVDIPPTTAKNAIHQLIELFGGERQMRVEAEGPAITKRLIDVLHRRGFDNGQTFEHGRNTMSTSRASDSRGVKTALYGYGASQENDGPRITFADVEWSVANGDPVDKPLGQIWVGDPEALQHLGYDQGRRHRFGEYSGQEKDPGSLLLNTWKDLQSRNDVVRTYEFQVVLFQNKKGYEHLRTRLGDTVYGFDREVQPNIEVEASVIIYRQNLNDSNLDEVTVGQFRNEFDVGGRVRSVEKVVETDRGKWDAKETPGGALAKAKSEAQKAIDYAQQQVDAANERIQQAETELSYALIRIEDSETEITSAKSRLTDNEIAIDEMQTQINSAESDISQAQTNISDAQNLIDSVTSEQNGVTVLAGTLITNEIIAQDATLSGTFTGSSATILNLTTNNMTAKSVTIENGTFTGTFGATAATINNLTTNQMSAIQATIEDATLTGTLTGSAATILDLTTENMIAIDATIQNATITGQLNGVSGTFTGDLVGGRILSNSTVDVTTDLSVGENIYMGDSDDYATQRMIRFMGGANISSQFDSISVSAMDFSVTDGNVFLGSSSSDVNILGDLNLEGDIVTDQTETEYCTLQGRSSGISGTVNVAGIFKTFKKKKTYTPSSVSFSATASNCTPNASFIKKSGFNFYISGDGDGYSYWTGTYTA